MSIKDLLKNELGITRQIKHVEGNFSCYDNDYKLTSLEGAPKQVDGFFSCGHSSDRKRFTKDDIRKVCDVKGSIYV